MEAGTDDGEWRPIPVAEPWISTGLDLEIYPIAGRVAEESQREQGLAPAEESQREESLAPTEGSQREASLAPTESTKEESINDTWSPVEYGTAEVLQYARHSRSNSMGPNMASMDQLAMSSSEKSNAVTDHSATEPEGMEVPLALDTRLQTDGPGSSSRELPGEETSKGTFLSTQRSSMDQSASSVASESDDDVVENESTNEVRKSDIESESESESEKPTSQSAEQTATRNEPMPSIVITSASTRQKDYVAKQEPTASVTREIASEATSEATAATAPGPKPEIARQTPDEVVREPMTAVAREPITEPAREAPRPVVYDPMLPVPELLSKEPKTKDKKIIKKKPLKNLFGRVNNVVNPSSSKPVDTTESRSSSVGSGSGVGAMQSSNLNYAAANEPQALMSNAPRDGRSQDARSTSNTPGTAVAAPWVHNPHAVANPNQAQGKFDQRAPAMPPPFTNRPPGMMQQQGYGPPAQQIWQPQGFGGPVGGPQAAAVRGPIQGPYQGQAPAQPTRQLTGPPQGPMQAQPGVPPQGMAPQPAPGSAARSGQVFQLSTWLDALPEDDDAQTVKRYPGTIWYGPAWDANMTAEVFTKSVWAYAGQVPSPQSTMGRRNSTTNWRLEPVYFSQAIHQDSDLRLLEHYVRLAKVSGVRALLQTGCNPGRPEAPRPEPVVNAVVGMSLQHNLCLAALLSRDATVNFRYKDSTPLHMALDNHNFQGFTDLIRLLLDAGANTNVRDDRGMSPLLKLLEDPRSSTDHSHLEVLALFLRRDSNTDLSIRQPLTNNTVLHVAVQRLAPAALAMLLHAGAELNATNALGITPLHMAIRGWQKQTWAHHVAVLDNLLKQKQRLNIDVMVVPEGTTALYEATVSENTEAVRMLLTAGANPNIECGGSWRTALHSACVFGYTEIAELLLEHGADPNKRTNVTYGTPLRAASQRKHEAIVALLQKHGAVPET